MRTDRILTAALMVVAALSLSVTAGAQSQEMSEAASKYNQMLYYIDRLYLEDVDFNDLVEKAVVATIG